MSQEIEREDGYIDEFRRCPLGAIAAAVEQKLALAGGSDDHEPVIEYSYTLGLGRSGHATAKRVSRPSR